METRSASSSPDPLGSPGDPTYLLSSARKTVSRPVSARNTPSPSKRRTTGSRRNAAVSRRGGTSAHDAKQQQLSTMRQQSIQVDDIVLPSTPPSTRRSNSPAKQQLHSNATLSPWRIRLTLEANREDSNDGQQLQQSQVPAGNRRKSIVNAMPSIEEERVLVPSGEGVADLIDKRRRKSSAYTFAAKPDTGVKRAMGDGYNADDATAGSTAKKRKSTPTSRRALASINNYNDVNGHNNTNNDVSPTEENVFTPRPEDRDPFLDMPLDETPRVDNRVNGHEHHTQAGTDFFPETPLEDIPEPSVADMGSNFRSTLYRPPRRINFSSPTKTSARTGLTPENTINAGHTPAPKIGLRKLGSDNKESDDEDQVEEEEKEENRVEDEGDYDESGSEDQTKDDGDDRTQSTRRRLSGEEGRENRTTTAHDPTNEHREFDSIMESEQFTMILPDKLPSAPQAAKVNGTGQNEESRDRPAAKSESQESKQSDMLAPVTSLFGKIAGFASRTKTTDGAGSSPGKQDSESQADKTKSPSKSQTLSASPWWKKGPTRPVIQHRQSTPPAVDVPTEPPAQSTPRPAASEPSPKLPPTPWWLRSPARSVAQDNPVNGSPSPRKPGNNGIPSPSKMLRLTPWWSRSPARIPLVRKDLTPAPSNGHDGLKLNLFARSNLMNPPSQQTRLSPTRAQDRSSQPSISPQKGPASGRPRASPSLPAIAEEEHMSPDLSSSSSVDEEDFDQGSPTPNRRQDRHPSRSLAQKYSPHLSPSVRKQAQESSNERTSLGYQRELVNGSMSGSKAEVVRPETPESSLSPPQLTPLKDTSHRHDKGDVSRSQSVPDLRPSQSRSKEHHSTERASSEKKKQQSPSRDRSSQAVNRHQRPESTRNNLDQPATQAPPPRHDLNTYPPNTHRKVLTTSGYFTDDHYLALRNLYKRAEAHPERFPYIRSTRRDSLLGREITSADGRYRRTVTQLQISVVDRFRDDLGYWDKRHNGGTGKVGWNDWELLRRLFSIIVGAEIRKEKARSHRKNRGHRHGDEQEYERLQARKGQQQQQQQQN